MSDIIFNEKNEVIDLKNKNTADYKSLAKNNKLSEKFILENGDFLDWNIISENQAITVKIMFEHAYKIKWAKIPTNPNIPTDAVLLGKYKLNMFKMFQKEPIDEDFLLKYKDFVQDREWEEFPTHKISIELIEKLTDRIFWADVFLHDRKDEAFIRRNIVNIERDPNEIERCWWHITTCQTLSEQFFRDFEDKIDFQFIAKKKDLNVFSDAFIEDFKYVLDKSNILKTQKDNLSKAYLKEYKDFDVVAFYKNVDEKWLENYISKHPSRISWETISIQKTLSDDFLVKFWGKFDLRFLPKNNKFTEELVRKIAPKMNEYDWDKVFGATTFSQAFLEEMLEKHSNKLHVGNISYSPSVANLSEDFIRKFQSVWNWKGVGQVKQFSEPFLREFENKWDWDWNIAYCQRVSESFLREFKHKFRESGWSNISRMQTLSEDFMREFADKLYWKYIFEHQKLSDEFEKEFKHQL